jgi:hypothetical protein
VRRITVRPVGFRARQTAIENKFIYQQSQFGILTPKFISHTQYRIDTQNGTAERDVQVTFGYGEFSRPEVDVTSEPVKAKLN